MYLRSNKLLPSQARLIVHYWLLTLREHKERRDSLMKLLPYLHLIDVTQTPRKWQKRNQLHRANVSATGTRRRAKSPKVVVRRSPFALLENQSSSSRFQQHEPNPRLANREARERRLCSPSVSPRRRRRNKLLHRLPTLELNPRPVGVVIVAWCVSLSADRVSCRCRSR